MKKIDKIKLALKNLLIEFRSINTDKAVLSWDGEMDLGTGVTVYITDEEGNTSVPEDGEYVAEDNTVYVIENGLVTAVILPDEEEPAAEEQPEAPAEEQNPEEEAPAEEPVEEPVAEEPVEEEPVAEEPVEEAPEEEPVAETPIEEVEEVAEEANEIQDLVNGLVEKISAIEEEIEALKAFKKDVEKMAAGKPAAQEYRQVKTFAEVKDKEIQNLNKLF